MVVTFYSFKGGVGRSMALANVAEVLADFGYSVIVCDWDLEAPGLEHYLCDDPRSIAEWRSQPGIIDLVQEYKVTIAQPLMAPQESPEYAKVDQLRLRRPSSYALPVPRPARQSNGSIRFLSAGRRDGPREAEYSAAVRDSDWAEFYSKWAGGSYFEFFREDLEKSARIVLIDSRTGVTELGGVCTHQMPDLVLLLSGANDQNLKGTEWMASVLSDAQLVERRKARPLLVLPIASRIDTLSEISMTTGFLRDFKEKFSRFVPDSVGPAQEFLQDSMIPYAGAFSFLETNVARLPAGQRHPVLYKPYQVLAEGIVRWGKGSGLLQAHEPGPAPLGLPRSPPANPTATGTAPLLPPGEYFLTWSEADRDLATDLAKALQAAGLNLWCDLLDGKLRDGEPVARQIQKAIARSVGCLILVPPQPIGPWMEAEINFALNRQAAHEGYRVMLVATESAPALPAALKRFPVFPLSAGSPASAASRLLAELLPAQKLSPEPSAELIIDILKAPSERESRFFFGREAEMNELLEKIEATLAARQSLLVLSGPAGSGITTLIRAGLIPSFQRGLVGGHQTKWRIAFVGLGRDDPEIQIRSAICQTLKLGPEDGCDWPMLLTALERNPGPLLIIVDDAELFLNPSPESATFILGKLKELQRACRAGFFVILSLRGNLLSDFEKIATPVLGPYALHYIPPLDATGIGQFFDGAARLLGVSYEPGLSDVLVADAMRFNAPTRSLGTVLQRLWNAKSPTEQLTHKAYRSFGGVEGLMVEDAGRRLEKIDSQTDGAVRRIILALLHARTGALLERPRQELLRPIELKPARLSVFEIFSSPTQLIGGTPEDNNANDQALTLLFDAGLILAGKDGIVRLANQSIARIPTIQQWMSTDAATHRLRTELEDRAENWHQADRPVDLLPRARDLRYLTRAQFTTEQGRDFLSAGIGAWRSRLGIGIALVLVGIFLVLATSAVGVNQGRKEALEVLRQLTATNSSAQLRIDAQAVTNRALLLELERLQGTHSAVESPSPTSLTPELKERQIDLLERCHGMSPERAQMILKAAGLKSDGNPLRTLLSQVANEHTENGLEKLTKAFTVVPSPDSPKK